MISLTPRQREILDCIHRTMTRTGCAPSLEEIARSIGLSSTATVHGHLRQLEARGWIRRTRHKTRAIELLDPPPAPPPPRRHRARPTVVELPVLGTVAAGGSVVPLRTAEVLAVPVTFAGGEASYAVRVQGQGMQDMLIRDGDHLVIENRRPPRRGRLVLAMIDGRRAEVKCFHPEPEGVRLVGGDGVAAIVLPAERVAMQGEVVTVLRRYT